ncbi:hypothetical protein CK203_061927 [Vitis vinifera]|uniref:Uncharacterized protein n=1 Tax=Vitis vinifera TaxID=29760 RepID=A0A438FR18_VITVI|nr:hypothetical protein CK203_061927 [Vitis vinifera]
MDPLFGMILGTYSTVMRAHGLDEPQMITLFPPISEWGGSALVCVSGVLETPTASREVYGQILPLVMLREETIHRTETDRGWRYQFIQSEAFQTPSADPTVFRASFFLCIYQYRPRAPRPAYDQTHMPQTLVLPSYATQGIERPAVSYTATRQPCYAAQFTAETCGALSPIGASRPLHLCFEDAEAVSQIGMPLSQALQKLIENRFVDCSTLGHYLSLFQLSSGWIYTVLTSGPGHETDRCTALRHAIQDLIDQVPPPAGGIHFLDFDETDDHVHMLSWGDPDPEPIMPVGFTRRVGPWTVQYILRGGRVVRHPPPAAARPVEGTSASQEEVRAEDDEILRQLQSTQARILSEPLASSSTHRDALTRAEPDQS